MGSGSEPGSVEGRRRPGKVGHALTRTERFLVGLRFHAGACRLPEAEDFFRRLAGEL